MLFCIEELHFFSLYRSLIQFHTIAEVCTSYCNANFLKVKVSFSFFGFRLMNHVSFLSVLDGYCYNDMTLYGFLSLLTFSEIHTNFPLAFK